MKQLPKVVSAEEAMREYDGGLNASSPLPGLFPTPYPWWVWAGLPVLVGAYAGWWGENVLSWPCALGLIGALIALGSLGAIYDWLVRVRRHVAHPWRGLLVALVAYGLIGGLVVGLFCMMTALGVAVCVDWIQDRGLRMAAGALVGFVAAGLGAWRVYRQRARNRIQAGTEPGQTTSGPA